jgi:hypothetical protein
VFKSLVHLHCKTCQWGSRDMFNLPFRIRLSHVLDWFVRRGHSRSPNAITVVMAAWDKFIEEELLKDVMETITKTAVTHTVYYFINYGKKSLLKHHPIDQFNGTLSMPSRQIANLHIQQRRFHKKLSQLVTSIMICNNLQQERSMPRQQEDQEEDSSSDESAEKNLLNLFFGSMSTLV